MVNPESPIEIVSHPASEMMTYIITGTIFAQTLIDRNFFTVFSPGNPLCHSDCIIFPGTAVKHISARIRNRETLTLLKNRKIQDEIQSIKMRTMKIVETGTVLSGDFSSLIKGAWKR